MPAISQSNLLQSLGWALINSLWQMAVIWVVYQLLLNLFNLRADKKVNLATAFLLAGFGWFIYTFTGAWLNGNVTHSPNSYAGNIINEEIWSNWMKQVLPLASAVYLMLLLFPVWQFIRNYRFVQLIRTRGLTRISADWKLFVRKMSDYMGINRNVNVWLSDLVQSPVTIGYLKPIILLPVAAINNLSTKQVEAILLHELSHIRRFDYLFNLVINFIRTILYFNPFVRAFVRSIEREREISCDQMVIQFQYHPHEYASALLYLQRTTAPTPKMLIAATGNNNLLNRVEAILGIRKKNVSFRRLAGAIAVLICMLSMNAFLFINAQKEVPGFVGFAQGNNPYYFMAADETRLEKHALPAKHSDIQVFAKQKQVLVIKPIVIEQYADANYEEEAAKPHFYNVNYTTPVMPDLTIEHEAKVKETVEATKKILEEQEWKEVANSYADLLNSTERSLLKDKFVGEVKNVDWIKLENQIRLAYDQIDWVKIDDKVCSSLAIIKLDSLKSEVARSLSELNKIEVWMKANNTTSIPDTDITLRVIQETQQKAKAQLIKVKPVRVKKIVKL